MVTYVVEGVLGSIVARVHSIDDVMRTVLEQMKLSDQAKAKLLRKLQAGGSRVAVDWGGVGCTVHIIDEEQD